MVIFPKDKYTEVFVLVFISEIYTARYSNMAQNKFCHEISLYDISIEFFQTV